MPLAAACVPSYLGEVSGVYVAISDASNDRERACEEVLGDVPHDVPWFQGGSGSRHLEAQVLLEVQAACMCENMQDCGAPSWVLSLCWTVQSEERGEGAPVTLDNVAEVVHPEGSTACLQHCPVVGKCGGAIMK
jgi:hypothetical protein